MVPFLSIPFTRQKRSFEAVGLEELVQTEPGHGLVFALLRLHLLPSSPRTSREIYSSLSIKGQDEPRQLSETITHSCFPSVPPCAIPLERLTPTLASGRTPAHPHILQPTYHTVCPTDIRSLDVLKLVTALLPSLVQRQTTLEFVYLHIGQPVLHCWTNKLLFVKKQFKLLTVHSFCVFKLSTSLCIFTIVFLMYLNLFLWLAVWLN